MEKKGNIWTKQKSVVYIVFNGCEFCLHTPVFLGCSKSLFKGWRFLIHHIMYLRPCSCYLNERNSHSCSKMRKKIFEISKNAKFILQIFMTKFSIFTAEKKNLCTLHGQVFVMYLFLDNTHDFIIITTGQDGLYDNDINSRVVFPRPSKLMLGIYLDISW